MAFPGIFSLGRDSHLQDLVYIPSRIEVLEIFQFGSAPPVVERSSLEQAQLEKWIEMPASSAYQNHESLIFELRLVLGPTHHGRTGPTTTSKFPNVVEDVHFESRSVPFSQNVFKSIVDKFRLPASTPWLLVTDSSHVQIYDLNGHGSPDHCIGLTMRRSTRGVVALNIKLSISHDSKAGRTCGLLLGCSDAQISFIVEQLKICSSLSWHPMFLPCLLTSYQHEMLSDETETLWEQLLQVETISGQTGAPVISTFRDDVPAFQDNQKSILGVLQLTAAWESNTNALLLAAGVIEAGFSRIKKITPSSRESAVDDITNTLKEYLQLTVHKSKVMLWDLQYINARAQAQTSAIYNLLAKQDNQISQQIAAATKRDSSAMKAIAALTMVFLPGTYISAFFAAPVLDFSTASKIPLPRPTFWLYWAVTGPTTAAIVIAYFSYAAVMKRRYHDEDRKAQNKAAHKTGHESSSPSGELKV